MSLTLLNKSQQWVIDNCPYKWEKAALKYLGIKLTPKLEHLYNQNFQLLLKRIENYLKKLVLQTNLMVWQSCHLKDDRSAKTNLPISCPTNRNTNHLGK